MVHAAPSYIMTGNEEGNTLGRTPAGTPPPPLQFWQVILYIIDSNGGMVPHKSRVLLDPSFWIHHTDSIHLKMAQTRS